MKRKDAVLALALAVVTGSAMVGSLITVEPAAIAPLRSVESGVLNAASTVAHLVPSMPDPAPAEQTAWDLPNLDHPRVDHWVNMFQTERRDDFAIFLQRKEKYEPMIREKLAERDMPQDLIYLAMIESGFNPTASSWAKAKGLWQFIEPTAKRYGLTVNRSVDERTDPVKSTDAALAYLGDLYEQFDSWYLAAAAYNTGENRVARIMRQVTGSEKGSEESYYEIAHHLPAETRDYVPLMIAAARIAKEPAKYGFDA